jgi:hypothetical protein
MEHPKRGARIDAELEKEGEEALENWRRERNNSSRTITKITTTHTIPEKVGREWDDMYLYICNLREVFPVAKASFTKMLVRMI